MENSKWHLLGRWVEPVLSGSFWVTFQNQSKKIGIDFFDKVESLDNYYFLPKDGLENLYKFVEDKINNDKTWFDTFFKGCDKQIENILRFNKHNGLSKLLECAVDYCDYFMILHILDLGFSRYIENMAEKTGIGADKVFSQINPCKRTILMKYQDDLKKVKRTGIKKFIKKWEWVGTHIFMGNPLTEEKLTEHKAGISKKTKKSGAQKLPDIYKDVIKIASKMAFYRTYMMEIMEIVTFKYWSDLKNLGEKHGLTWNEIRLLTHEEIINLNNRGILPRNFKEREKGYGDVYENDKSFIVTGKELRKRLDECQEKIGEDIKEVKGMVAYKSDKKIIGIAKIVESAEFLSKIKKGDVLIAPETIPNYIVGMKIAGAIVTNQGGVTSHAAIVSRELKIPCIIGTKIATKVFKDGDKVEVDTNTGTVRIIK